MPNHELYQKLTWKEKNERIGKIIHLFQNNESAFEDMNRLIDIADRIEYFKDIDFFPTTRTSQSQQEEPAMESHITNYTTKTD